MKVTRFHALALIGLFTCGAFSQTPTPELPDKIATEEIRVSVSALDRAGNAVTDLQKDDLVISEDGRLHQASSVRALEPSVLIAMDTGGTIRQKKNLETTRSVASAFAGELNGKAQVALIQFHDRAERLADWTSDKREIVDVIYGKTGFGRRSSFTRGIEEAEAILASAPTLNRHLVLITDGLDTIEDEAARSAAIRKLWQSGVVVHVISYTELESKDQRPLGGLLQKGEHNPRRIPEHVMEELVYAIPVRKTIARDILRQIYQPRLISIIIDRPFLRAQKNQSKDLATAQVQLSVLSEYTGGEFYLPDNFAEMTEQGRQIAHNINSQYVVTYTPKRPIKEVAADEIRQIEVTSRRSGVEVRASRRLVIFGTGQTR
ncbi:MAG: VWA domain-containing protein [Acidobacteria bacterium]|nr:VWA domain-containing protein [Acidobacteriota bacterium]